MRTKVLVGNLLESGRRGAVAQLGERSVRNAEVEGSIPFRSTRSNSDSRKRVKLTRRRSAVRPGSPERVVPVLLDRTRDRIMPIAPRPAPQVSPLQAEGSGRRPHRRPGSLPRQVRLRREPGEVSPARRRMARAGRSSSAEPRTRRDRRSGRGPDRQRTDPGLRQVRRRLLRQGRTTDGRADATSGSCCGSYAGSTARPPSAAFGPLALKAVREEMIRAGNCRSEINRRVGRIVRMFKWGVSEELVPPVGLRGPQDRLRAPQGPLGGPGEAARSGRSRTATSRRSGRSSAARSGP